MVQKILDQKDLPKKKEDSFRSFGRSRYIKRERERDKPQSSSPRLPWTPCFLDVFLGPLKPQLHKKKRK